MKKLLSVFLVLVMVLGMMPWSASPATAATTISLNRPLDKAYTITAGEYYSDGSYHGAIDYGCPKGTPVYAAESGTITIYDGGYGDGWYGCKDGSGWGNYADISHGNGYSTRYAHMSTGRFVVSSGSYVQRGQLIGYSGNSGNSTGAHLHFGLYFNGSKVYPESYIKTATGYFSNEVSHTVDSSYGTNFTAYPKAKITAENIFDANHNQISSTAWIGTSDLCTIHEVYTDGCCKITYPLDNGGTKTVYSRISLFDVYINTLQVYCSTNSVSLKIGETESQVVYVGYSGYYSGDCLLGCERSNSNISCTWGEWTDDHRMPVTIQANAMGTTTITFYMQDKDTEAVVCSTTVTVTVGAKSYTVTYNANGGSGAPGSQTKYHNTTLTLSSAKPTRSGYTFLGWATSSTATSANYQPGGDFTVNENTTLYAVWKRGCEENAHNYNSVVTEPTCTEDGYTTHTCAYCGDSYVDTYTSAWGHEYGEWYVSVEATCEGPGEERRDCQYCDLYETRATDPWGHEFGEWYVSVEATCEGPGEERRDCQYCDLYETRATDPLGHYYISEVTSPTCTEQGYTTHTCVDCGDNYVDSYVDAWGHEYGEWYVTLEATCVEQGEERRDCRYCDHFETRATKAKGHDYTSEVTYPTCTEPGYTTYTCSVCRNRYQDDFVDATGHSHVVTDAKDAACVEDGYITYTCHCGDSYTEVIPATGHSYVDGECEHCGEADPDAILVGDVNGDGIINYLDAMHISQYYVGMIGDDAINAAAADVNGDDRVDYLDAMMVAQFYVGIIDSFK